MEVQDQGRGSYFVTPPTCRVDIAREIDLIEEVIRLYGYDRVPVTLPDVSVSEQEPIARLDLEERIRQLMTGSGFNEVVNYSFGTPVAADTLSLRDDDERRNIVKIKNPLGEELSAMRTTLIFGLLDTARRNANNGSFDLRIFEIGRTFIAGQTGELPREKNILAGLLTGKVTEDFWDAANPIDFYHMKGCLENIFRDLKINHCRYVPSAEETFLHPGKACKIMLDEKQLGWAGEVHPDIKEKFDLKNCAYVFEINLDLLSALALNSRIFFQELSKFPAVTRDAAFVIPEQTEADAMLDAIRQQKEDLLETISIFDVYKGKGLPEGTKSLGLRFSYRAADRTLTDAEAGAIHEKIVQKTVASTGAKIRS